MLKPLLSVKNLTVRFKMYSSRFKQEEQEVVNDLSLDIYRGEILAVVGASGSGKSILAHAIFGLLPDNASATGLILYDGKVINKNMLGSQLALIPQSVSYLDPLMKVGKQVQGHNGYKLEQKQAFERYNLDSSVEAMYPHQLSGGMARRILISTAVVGGAELIIADEPTAGIDTETAIKAMDNFKELALSGKGIMLITHDIDLAINAADRVAVFYGGSIIEVAKASDFKDNGDKLRHPYSKALYNALPQNEFKAIDVFDSESFGCFFYSPCPYKTCECLKYIPLRDLRCGLVRCVHAS